MRIAVVVTAAGSSERFGGGKKELLPLGERSMLEHAISPFLSLPGVEALVVTAPSGREADFRAAISPDSLEALARLGPGRFAVVAGGDSRRDSVRLGLEAAARIIGGSAMGEDPAAIDDVIVLVHDGARPWASAGLVASVAEDVAIHGASVPILPLVDTPKQLRQDGIIVAHPPRSSLGGAQTPQGFRLGSLLAAHRRAALEGLDCTDDAELWDHYVGPVSSVPGEAGNRKVTFAADIADADARDSGRGFRMGQGWDIHRLVPGRALMLGGVAVPSELGEDAHSDGDVLLHAIIDALLGAAALGDIGSHFPPSDELWRGADSRELAGRVVAMVREAGWRPGNLDCSVVIERPRLGPHRDAMRASIAATLGIEMASVSVKAKTKEGLDAVGEGRAVEAFAIVTLFSLPDERPR